MKPIWELLRMKPDAGDPPVPKARLEKAEGILRAILKGDKPFLDPQDPDTGWIFAQLSRMYEGHFITEPANAYVMLPGEGEPERLAKGDTRFHPASYRLSLQDRKLRDKLQNAGIGNFYMLGFRQHLGEELGNKRKPLRGLADHFIATKGNIKVLYDSVRLMLDNFKTGQTPQKFLVLQNKGHFWNPAIEGLGLDDPAKADLVKCAVTGSISETKNAILFSGLDQNRLAETPSRLPPARHLLFASTQPKKMDETRQIIEHDKWDVTLGEAVEVLHWFFSADELSKSYEGNCHEKALALIDRVYNYIGYDAFAERCRERGWDPDHVAFLVNDTGNSFTPDLSAEPEFAPSRAEAIPGKPWPGVEMGPVTDAQGGTRQFMIDFNRAAKRLGLKETPRYRDTQVYMEVRLAPRREDVRINSWFGTDTGYLLRDPRQEGGSLYSEHFCVPDGQAEKANGKTKAELGHAYLVTDSSQARALRAYAYTTGMPKSLTRTFNAVGNPRVSKALRLGTQANWMQGNAAIALPAKTGWETRKRSYGDFETMAQAFDGFLLGRHGAAVLKDFDQGAVERGLLFWKLVTHRQILHDTMRGKPFWVVNPALPFVNENGAAELNWEDPKVEQDFLRALRSIDPEVHPWGRELMLYSWYHEKSMIKQQPKYLFTQVQDEAQLPDLLRQARKDFQSHPVIPYKREEFGRDRHDLFEVAVIASAGTRNPLYKASGWTLGYKAAANGMHVRTGGGRYGVMDSVSRGWEDFCEKHPERAGATHISAIQMPRTLQFEGLCFDPKDLMADGSKYIAIEPDMDSRMENILRADVVVVDAGGAGTIEEIYKYLALKKQGALPKHSALIVINHQNLGPDNLRLYDPLLAVLPKEDLKSIHVVPDADAAIQKAVEIRNRLFRPASPVLKASPSPF